MDAVSFVLGVHAKQLRGAKLKDLVYHVAGEEGAEEKNGGAWVQLVLLHGPEGQEEEILFRRTITASGSSEYSINGHTVSWEKYDASLQKFGILAKCRNFLVFQVHSLLGTLSSSFLSLWFSCEVVFTLTHMHNIGRRREACLSAAQGAHGSNRANLGFSSAQGRLRASSRGEEQGRREHHLQLPEKKGYLC